MSKKDERKVDIDKSIYVRKEDAEDIVSYLVLDLLIRDKKKTESIVKIPLGAASEDLTFTELGDLALVVYCDDYDSEETYGFSYSIEEIK